MVVNIAIFNVGPITACKMDREQEQEGEKREREGREKRVGIGRSGIFFRHAVNKLCQHEDFILSLWVSVVSYVKRD